MSLKKLLIIANEFPPVGGAGVQRPVKIVKYLKQFGWEPIVLTVMNPSTPVIDHGLIKDIPPNTIIYKSKTLEPSYTLKSNFGNNNTAASSFKRFLKKIILNIMLPDMQILWWPGLIWSLVQIIRVKKPHCIFVTAPPFSAFVPVTIIGYLCDIPVILDYRDEWSFARNNLENSSKNWFASTVDKFLENLVVKMCSAITAANNSYIQSLAANYLNGDTTKCHVITNGYDEDDFVSIDKSQQYRKYINLVYSGTVWNATSLSSFLAAVQSSKKLRLNLSIKVTIYGRIVDTELKCIEELREAGLINVIELKGYLEHDKLIPEICDADILLLTLSCLHGSEKIICGKVFEYMATGKHILAIVPEGETKNILETYYDNMTIVNPSNISEISAALEYLTTNIDTVRKYKGKGVSQFSRKHLTHKLAIILDSVVK